MDSSLQSSKSSIITHSGRSRAAFTVNVDDEDYGVKLLTKVKRSVSQQV